MSTTRPTPAQAAVLAGYDASEERHCETPGFFGVVKGLTAAAHCPPACEDFAEREIRMLEDRLRQLKRAWGFPVTAGRRDHVAEHPEYYGDPCTCGQRVDSDPFPFCPGCGRHCTQPGEPSDETKRKVADECDRRAIEFCNELGATDDEVRTLSDRAIECELGPDWVPETDPTPSIIGAALVFDPEYRQRAAELIAAERGAASMNEAGV